jgi:hypothetical protein
MLMGILATVLIILTAALVVILVAKNIASHEFKCKHCSSEFNIRWYKVLVTVHSAKEYMLECPFCHTKDWCTEQPKNIQK